jgi:hypothetical protein
MIKIVLPVCQKQAAMVSRLVHRFQEFNDMKDRDILLVCTWEDHFDVPELAKFLSPVFANVSYAVIPDIPEFAEWPMVGNHMFYHTAQHLHEHENKDPWYFFEPDNWPLYPNWMAAFDSEYEEAAMPYMGAVNTTRLVDRRTGKSEAHGRHMVGTGVYPADFFTRSRELHFLDSEAWDIALQDEILPDCHETPLIFHAWNTGKYHVTPDKKVIGVDFGPNKGRYGGRPVPLYSMVVHGCKDDSLSKIDFATLQTTL